MNALHRKTLLVVLAALFGSGMTCAQDESAQKKESKPAEPTEAAAEEPAGDET